MTDSPEEIDMHREVDWMVPADTYVLRYMATVKTHRGEAAIQRPATISDNISYSRKHIGARCLALSEKGLLEKLGRGKYRITELGLEFAEGKLSPEDLEEL